MKNQKALALLQELVGHYAILQSETDDYGSESACIFCDGLSGWHKSDCLVSRARELLAAKGVKYHAFQAIQMERDGGEAILDTFRVTKKRSANDAFRQAETRCVLARILAHRPHAFVREINPPLTTQTT